MLGHLLALIVESFEVFSDEKEAYEADKKDEGVDAGADNRPFLPLIITVHVHHSGVGQALHGPLDLSKHYHGSIDQRRLHRKGQLDAQTKSTWHNWYHRQAQTACQ